MPTESPASPGDVIATLYHLLGVAPQMNIHNALDRPHPFVPTGLVMDELISQLNRPIFMRAAVFPALLCVAIGHLLMGCGDDRSGTATAPVKAANPTQRAAKNRQATNDGQSAITLKGHTNAVSSMAFRPDGKRLTSAQSVADQPIVGQEEAMLTQAPFVPPPIKRKHATKVIVKLEVREVVKKIAAGVDYVFWTFGGDVPGSFIRVREGDLIEFHLANHPSSKMPHNIDLHAVTGPGGGASSSFTAPGHASQFSFLALNPGLYVYHCATAPVGMHVANGMYGLILVEPKAGLPPVDREFYVMQGDFYTAGRYGAEGLQPFDLDKAVDERPTYVLFNGSVGSLVGDRALKAAVGENIRLYVGNGGPNLVSSFHVIGEIFDTVYPEGGTQLTQKNVQTTLVPAGGAVIVDFRVEVPGTYILVDHSLFRAFNKGALGMLKIEGAENKLIYSGKEVDAIYLGSQAEAGTDAAKRIVALQAALTQATKTNTQLVALTKELQIEKGRQVYMQTCFVCHQPNGQGLPGQIPPVAASDYLMADKERSIRGVLQGQSGEIVVNGKKYNADMIPFNTLTDDQVANVLTFVRNSWGNSGEAVTVEEVRKVRRELPAPKASPFE